jgi:hypothetical protein
MPGVLCIATTALACTHKHARHDHHARACAHTQVINAVWRLLSHDLDRVLRGAADGALRAIRDARKQQQQQLGGPDAPASLVTKQEAAVVLLIMARLFQVRRVAHAQCAALGVCGVSACACVRVRVRGCVRACSWRWLVWGGRVLWHGRSSCNSELAEPHTHTRGDFAAPSALWEPSQCM